MVNKFLRYGVGQSAADVGTFKGFNSLGEMVPSLFLSSILSDMGASSISIAEMMPSSSRSSATIKGEGPGGGGGGVVPFGGGGWSSLRVSMPSPFLSRSPSVDEDLAISRGESAPSWLESSTASNGGGGGVAALAEAAATNASNRWMGLIFMVCWLMGWAPLSGNTVDGTSRV